MTALSHEADNFWDAFPKFMAAAQTRVDADYRMFDAGGTGKPPVLSFEEGGRYVRIVVDNGSQRSAFGFVDKTNGDVLKAAGWKAPAKNFARGNIFDTNQGTGRIRWTGIH